IEQLPQAYFLLGTIFYDKGQLERAIKSFQSAIKLDPEYEEAIYHLGLTYLDRNWNRKALDCFQEALELNPNKIEYQQAVKIYEGISGHVPLQGPAADEVLQAESLVNQGNYIEALDRRSEERRVGKECRYRWAREHEKKKIVESVWWRHKQT